jgi:membrane fusion protein (multidrug efflux system)
MATTHPGVVSAETKGERTGPNPAVRLALIVLGAIVLLVAIFYGVKFLAYATTHETTDDATIDADVVQVTSKISERVNHIYVDTNQRVKRGELLMTLDDSNEKDAYNQAKAAVAAQEAQARAAFANVTLTRDTQQAQNLEAEGSISQAKANISNASAEASSADQQIAVAQAGVDAENAQLKVASDAVPGALQNLRKAQADLARTEALVKSGDVAAQQLDADRAAYEAARSQYSQALANVGAAQANLAQAQQKLASQRFSTVGTQSLIGVQQGSLTTAQGKYQESDAPSRVAAQEANAQAAQAQIGALHAQLATASDNLSYTRIVSPIDGYVGQKNVEIGQTVAPGESLMTLIPATHVYVTANFKETQIGHMKVGQETDINVDAYKGVKFIGHVDNLSRVAEHVQSRARAKRDRKFREGHAALARSHLVRSGGKRQPLGLRPASGYVGRDIREGQVAAPHGIRGRAPLKRGEASSKPGRVRAARRRH